MTTTVEISQDVSANNKKEQRKQTYRLNNLRRFIKDYKHFDDVTLLFIWLNQNNSSTLKSFHRILEMKSTTKNKNKTCVWLKFIWVLMMFGNTNRTCGDFENVEQKHEFNTRVMKISGLGLAQLTVDYSA
jgi:hypothetical protein